MKGWNQLRKFFYFLFFCVCVSNFAKHCNMILGGILFLELMEAFKLLAVNNKPCFSHFVENPFIEL
jgi:hypothetical protein